MNWKQGVVLCVKWATDRQRKREGETDFFYTFCTISSLFPPWRPLSAECAEYAFHGQEAMEPARTKKIWKKKGREKRSSSLLHCNTERWSYYPENLTTLFFSLFIPEFPEHWATITTRILGPHTGYPLWRWGRRKTQTLLVAKCIGLYFCPASRLIGVHVRQPMVVWGWGSTVGRNIRTVG